MALNPLDIRNFFEEMELNLIANLIRNIFHHKDEEKKEGFNWRAWQAEALKNIDIFRRRNAKDVNSKRPVIDESTKKYLDEQYSEGSGNRERLKFFRFNSDRYDALASEAQTVNENIYSSALRNVDDVYRQVVAKRRLNMRSGGMSLRQAIDSATQDFLDRGITSIQYRDGKRVNIASYREMALRTAGSRAQFIADGQLREMMGRDLVLISQYGACSKTCLPWQGRVYIDDVFQEYHGEKLDGGKNGISRNGKKYTLLSYAMAGGLFHPNCRHTMVDYIEGITEIPPRLDAKTVRKNSELEQEQRAKEREIRRLKRYVTGTLDPDKRKEYGLQLDAAQKDLAKFISDNSDVLRRDPWREQLKVPFTEDDTFAIIGKQISGALNPKGKRASQHADRYYQAIRKMTGDVKRIANNINVEESTIQKIKDYLFIEAHDLGEGSYRQFWPSFEIAQSWQRLIEGKSIQPHDITLINHEIMEMELIEQGYAQGEAHTITSLKYNYREESERFYDKGNKNNER